MGKLGKYKSQIAIYFLLAVWGLAAICGGAYFYSDKNPKPRIANPCHTTTQYVDCLNAVLDAQGSPVRVDGCTPVTALHKYICVASGTDASLGLRACYWVIAGQAKNIPTLEANAQKSC